MKDVEVSFICICIQLIVHARLQLYLTVNTSYMTLYKIYLSKITFLHKGKKGDKFTR